MKYSNVFTLCITSLLAASITTLSLFLDKLLKLFFWKRQANRCRHHHLVQTTTEFGLNNGGDREASSRRTIVIVQQQMTTKLKFRCFHWYTQEAKGKPILHYWCHPIELQTVFLEPWNARDMKLFQVLYATVALSLWKRPVANKLPSQESCTPSFYSGLRHVFIVRGVLN